MNPQNATKTADGTAGKLTFKARHTNTTNLRRYFLLVPGIITMSDEEAQEHFDNFFEDVFVECEDKVMFNISIPLYS